MKSTGSDTKAALKESTPSIIETNNFSVIAPFLSRCEKDTLVIFDVDNTLLTPKDAILHAKNSTTMRNIFQRFENEFPKEHCDKLWTIIALQRTPKLVDDSILNAVNQLKTNGIKAIALTKFSTGSFGLIESVETWRFNELDSLGINFSYSFPHHPELIYLRELEPGKGNYPLYKSGIIFTATQNKAEALEAFLHKINYLPKQIIFTDDCLEYLQLVKTFCSTNNIDFQGFHYTAIYSENTPPFNEERVALQFKTLKEDRKWLSDQEADANLSKLTLDTLTDHQSGSLKFSKFQEDKANVTSGLSWFTPKVLLFVGLLGTAAYIVYKIFSDSTSDTSIHAPDVFFDTSVIGNVSGECGLVE